MRNILIILFGLAATATPVAAQLTLPPVGGGVGDILGSAGRALDPVTGRVNDLASHASRLAAERAERLRDLVRRDSGTIEFDNAGELARRGELIIVNATDADINVAVAAGYTLLGSERLDQLGLSATRLGVPGRTPLGRAEARLKKLLPDAIITADNLHQQSGEAATNRPTERVRATAAPIDATVGIIDGAPAATSAAIRGFARGAPFPSNHGSAIASLLNIAGVRSVAVADVYGTDPAGGNALAISRGINWLVSQDAKVISISLVGPRNPLLGQAIAAAQGRGVVFVAAVGNDGPAAPPAFPASYPGVIAVTGVDGRNRVLIEAGRALHLDYAAPGADMRAADARGRWVKVRGTSYAVPLIAARAAAAVSGRINVTNALDREAIDLGTKGPDASFGRGLVCASCRRR
ncbi:MAG TPA: S8 family serine peptidase [Novosphingobium sp.]|nr:S8 family serine peptidase [Novosphingobium sp.]